MFSRIKKAIKDFRELKYLAYHDSLTKLLNRNWIHKNLDFIRVKYQYIYFIDINDLREINKSGHTYGDEYIKKVVNSIHLYDDDILCRYAGDEFILFSNRLNAIKTNYLFAVGFFKMGDNCIESIQWADIEMIRAKNEYKLKK